MATKEEFTAAAKKAGEAGRITNAISEATSTEKADPEKASTKKKAAPKKGDLPRVNIALEKESYDIIKTLAKATGTTQQAVIQRIINEYIAEHKEIKKAYDATQKALNDLFK